MTHQPGHERPGDTVPHQDEIEELIDEENNVRISTVKLTSADILALHTTPVELVPAPGPSKIVGLINLTCVSDSGEAYSQAADDVRLFAYGLAPFTEGGGNVIPVQQANRIVVLNFGNIVPSAPADGADNAPVMVDSLSPITDGTMTIIVTTLYYVVDVI